MIKAIAFDCGGVLFPNDWNDDSFDIILKKLEIDRKKSNEIFLKHWPEIRIGKKSGDVFFQDLLNVSTQKISFEELKELYYSCITKKDTFEVVEKLHEKYPRLPLYTLNDEGKEWMDFRIAKFGLNKYFRDFITSGYVGYAKTDKRIYQILLERTGLKAEEILFIDDKENRLIPAKDLGYNTILFKNRQQLEKELENYGFRL